MRLLKAVFTLVCNAGLTVKLKKFLRKKIMFLQVKIMQDGIKMDCEKTEPITFLSYSLKFVSRLQHSEARMHSFQNLSLVFCVCV